MPPQCIDSKQGTFYMIIAGQQFFWKPPKLLFREHELRPLPAHAKGSTLGWYIKRKWVSYNQLKEAAELFKKSRVAIQP